jgi:hypothetical protein
MSYQGGFMIRVNIVRSTKGIRSIDKMIDQLTKQVKQLNSQDIHITKSLVSMKNYAKIVKKIEKLPFVSSAHYGTISHMPGLGGMYGDGLTVYINQTKLPYFMIDKNDGQVMANTVLFMEKFKHVDMSFLVDNDDQDFDSMVTQIENHFHVTVNSGDNTYNHSSDLSQDIAFYSFNDPKHEMPTLMLYSLHMGGDARCNYSDFKLIELDYDDYCNFVTGMSVGFHVEGDETGHYESGYSNESQYHFFNDFEFVKLNSNGSLKVKNKETGKEVIAWPDHSGR